MADWISMTMGVANLKKLYPRVQQLAVNGMEFGKSSNEIL